MEYSNLLSRIKHAFANNFPSVATLVYEQKKDRENQSKKNSLIQKSGKRLLIDVSNLATVEYVTGIQRLVINICRELIQDEQLEYEIAFVTNYKNELRTRNSYIYKLCGHTYHGEEYIIIPNDNDLMLFIDASWLYTRRLTKIMKGCSCKKIAVAYDLIPIEFPDLVTKYSRIMFEKWLKAIIAQCDSIICISNTVEQNIISYINKNKVEYKKNLEISNIKLGCDIKRIGDIHEDKIRKDVKETFDGKNVYLMVGTIEPRKGHDIAIKAISDLNDEGIPSKLLIIGKYGWGREKLVDEILKSKHYGTNIIWKDDIDDTELAYCYKNSTALVNPSIVEGFGLPLIEAAYYGIPIICSNIPIFREVVGENALYFESQNVESLKNVLRDDIKYFKRNDVDSNKICLYTWQDSKNQLVNKFHEADRNELVC